MAHPTVAPESFALDCGVYQGSIYFLRRPPMEPNPKIQQILAQVVMSPILMKCLAIKLKKFLREFEDENGPIVINPTLANKEGFSMNEDWA